MGQGKLVSHQINLVSSSGLSTTAFIYSQPLRVAYMDNVGIQFKWSGTPTGSFFVDGSIDYQQTDSGVVTNAGNWVVLGSTAVGQAQGTSGIFAYTTSNLPYPYIRTRYVPSSASTSGVVDIWAFAKQI